MINFSFRIYNPFSDRFDSGKVWHGLIGKSHKAWEIQAMRTNSILELEASFTARTDHAGLSLELGLIGFNISAKIYDTRHWNHETKDWEVYEKDSIL